MTSKRKRFYRPEITSLNIPDKANRILNLILIILILILLRIWQLTIVQHDAKLEESRRPQRKVVIEPSKRGTIRDRFNVPLAINKIQYQAAIVYSQLRQVPSVLWEKDAQGKKIKRLLRKEYITKLARLLGEELGLDAERLEDLIYAKASFYNQFPFIIKEEISEKEYYRLKMLEKDWLGIHVQAVPKRHYPLQRVGSDIIGYMGAINHREYEQIIHEIKELQTFIKDCDAGEDPALPENILGYEDACQRIKELEAHAYTINDQVGKGGIEGYFEEYLRGYHGKKSYYSDARGNFLRELPDSREPLSGQRLLLSISAELQEFAEKLLAQNERIREAQVSGVDSITQAITSLRQPWIKGGAIVAMDPNNGEIVALATYPRFNPNDFISSGVSDANRAKRSNIARWFENESYIASIWDQKRPLERERYDDDREMFFDEPKKLDLAAYLEFILPKTSLVRIEIERMNRVENAVALQKNVARLLEISGQNNAYWLFNLIYQGEEHIPYKSKIPAEIKSSMDFNLKLHAKEVADLKKKIDPFLQHLTHQYEKVLLVDLCRVLVPGELFSEELLKSTGKQSLASYRDTSAAMATINETVKEMTKDLFHELTFKPWRAKYEKGFLKKLREEEKLAKTYPKPYIDYLDAQEKAMFQAFWEAHRLKILSLFLTGQFYGEYADELQPYLETFITWNIELMQGAHQSVSWRAAYDVIQKAIKGIPPEYMGNYFQTLRGYQDLTRPLLGQYRHLRKTSEKKQLEKHLAAAFYPLYGYGYGRSQAYRQAATQGSIFKLVTAYEALVQKYHKLEGRSRNFNSLNPLEIVDAFHRNGKDVFVGFNQDGTPIPQLYKGGRLLKSASAGIGKIDMLRAIETSSNPYFSLLAGDIFHSPEDLSKAAKLFSYGTQTGIELPWEISGKVPSDLATNRTGLYAMANGQHTLVVTPLQTAVMLSSIANGGKIIKPNIVQMSVANKLKEGRDINLINRSPVEIRKVLFMPDVIRNMLLEGMRRVVHKQIKESLTRLSRFYRDYPEAISDFLDLKEQLVGKTSTAESMENIDLDINQGTNLYTHVWFGGIAFNSDILGINRDTIVFKDSNGQPELVVVVYLKYGAWGKESAPLAALMVKKWREIKAKHEKERLNSRGASFFNAETHESERRREVLKA